VIPLHKAWALIRAPLAWATSTLGFPPGRRVYTSLNTLAVPVTRGDARSYHIEVVADHPALSLVPRSAYFATDEREYYFKWLRHLALRVPTICSVFPNRKVEVEQIFGRVTDSSERVQHFYTTRLPGEPHLVQPKDSCAPGAGGGSLLVLRYGVPFYIVATNWVLALSLAALAIMVLSGMIGPSKAVGAAEWTRLLSPLYLGTVVLFAVERHNSPLLVHKVKGPALVVLLSLLAFGAGATAWFL
jgi:hypothetical protein